MRAKKLARGAKCSAATRLGDPPAASRWLRLLLAPAATASVDIRQFQGDLLCTKCVAAGYLRGPRDATRPRNPGRPTRQHAAS